MKKQSMFSWIVAMLAVLALATGLILAACDDDDDDDSNVPDDDNLDDDIADDDVADDDVADDDVADDDITDDDTGGGQVDDQLQTDDGSAENGIWLPGDEGPFLAKVLKPTHYPSYLSEVSLWLTQYEVPNTFEIGVRADETGGSPEDSVAVWSSGLRTDNPPTWPYGEWFTFDVDGKTPSIDSGTWVVGVIFHLDLLNELAIGYDTDFGEVDNKTWGLNQGIWYTASELSAPVGTLMIRAKAYYFE